jgi:hypothetical protein
MSEWLENPPGIIKRGRPRTTLREELKAHPGKWRAVKLNEGRHLVAEGFERVQRKGADGVVTAFMRWPANHPNVIEASATFVAQANNF